MLSPAAPIPFPNVPSFNMARPSSQKVKNCKFVMEGKSKLFRVALFFDWNGNQRRTNGRFIRLVREAQQDLGGNRSEVEEMAPVRSDFTTLVRGSEPGAPDWRLHYSRD